MQQDGIMVAEYWTELPPKEMLEQKIHRALIEARERKVVQALRLKACGFSRGWAMICCICLAQVPSRRLRPGNSAV